MPEIRCNVGSVYDLADRTRKQADELELHSKSSTNELNNELNSWAGDSSDGYKENAQTNSNNTEEIANAMRAYADYLEETADTIKEADEYCATAKI